MLNKNLQKMIDKEHQGQGNGKLLLQALLEHPALLGVERVYLMTTNQAGQSCNDWRTLIISNSHVRPSVILQADWTTGLDYFCVLGLQ